MLADAFIRGTGLILPYNAPGADLIIPVWRRDNKITVIAIQVKNIAANTFPHQELEVVDKLFKLDFLDLTAVPGQFEAVEPEDFVRIVLQFREQVAGAFLPQIFCIGAKWTEALLLMSLRRLRRGSDLSWKMSHRPEVMFFGC